MRKTLWCGRKIWIFHRFVVTSQTKTGIMTIEEIQQEVVEEFQDYDDWMDRYQLLIDLGNDQEQLPESDKTESNLID